MAREKQISDIGVAAMIRHEREVDVLGQSVSDRAWDISLDMYNLGVDRTVPAQKQVYFKAKGNIESDFRDAGSSDYGTLTKGHEGKTLNLKQEQLWEDVTDAVAMCVFLQYGDDDKFLDEVFEAKKLKRYDLLESRYFDTPELRGVGRVVADLVPTNEVLREQMLMLSRLAKNKALSLPFVEGALATIAAVNTRDTDAQDMLLGYLGEIVTGIRSSVGAGTSGSQSEAYAAQQLTQMKEIDETTINDLIDAFLYIRPPRNKTREPSWEYEAPEWVPHMSKEEWRKLLSYSEGWLGAIYNKRNDDRYNNDMEYVGKGILSMHPLIEGLLRPWFNHPDLQVREVMHQIMKDLLVPHEVKGVVDGKNVTRKVYSFEVELDPNDKNYEEQKRPQRMRYKSQLVRTFTTNEGEYKDKLVERLTDGRNGLLRASGDEISEKGTEEAKKGSIKRAKIAVSLAMDIMEMGGVFTVADSLRKLTWESDAVRIAQRPDTKIRSKGMGGEIWGGPWLVYCLQGGDNTALAYQRAKDLGIVPVLLSGSFMDLSYMIKEDETTFADRIWANQKFDLKEGDADPYFSWRKDHIKPAINMWFYITKKTPFELRQLREFDNVVSDWREGLFNAYRQLKSNTDALCTTKLLAACIGGSTGLWPFAGPYLRVSGPEGDGKHQSAFEVMYTVGQEILTGLGLSRIEMADIKEFFGLNRKYRIDFMDRITDYLYVHNPKVSEKERDKVYKALQRPRE